jgi:ADP-L-glycero-D-manno-heptose 6-epimerase
MLRSTAEDGRVELFSDTLEAARDYVPVAHVTDTILRLLRSRACRGLYNLGAGQAISFATLAQWCAEFHDNGSVDVRLIPNPIPDRYQYWTCADMAALRVDLPDISWLDADDIRRAAAELYVSFSPPHNRRNALPAPH